MTKAQLRTAIKREARVLTGATLDPLIDDIVSDILTDYCNLARFYELLQEDVPVTLIDGQAAYALPVDYHHLESVRYGRGPNPTAFRTVVLQPPTVKQTWATGWPRFYRLTAGPKISFWPHDNIVIADKLYIDYYVTPSSLYTTDASPFPIPRLESAVKKDAIARVQRFHSANQESAMTDADAAASFNSSNAAE